MRIARAPRLQRHTIPKRHPRCRRVLCDGLMLYRRRRKRRRGDRHRCSPRLPRLRRYPYPPLRRASTDQAIEPQQGRIRQYNMRDILFLVIEFREIRLVDIQARQVIECVECARTGREEG